jgi:hypothetical protein
MSGQQTLASRCEILDSGSSPRLTAWLDRNDTAKKKASSCQRMLASRINKMDSGSSSRLTA